MLISIVLKKASYQKNIVIKVIKIYNSANGSSLEVSYKLRKGYINVQNNSFKNVFIIVKNITNDIILGTRFLSQIYPFYTDNIGVHTQVIGKTIPFPFLSPTMQLEISQLQNSSPSEQNTLKLI